MTQPESIYGSPAYDSAVDFAMPEQTAEDPKEIAQKLSESETATPTPDICEAPAAPAGEVPVPYPNTSTSRDATSGSKKVKVEGKEAMTERSSYETSTGDEPGQTGAAITERIVDAVNSKKLFKVPLWVWGFAVAVLIVVIWLWTLSGPQPAEPMETYLIKLLSPFGNV
jgi:hypothetical protein